MTRRFLDRYHAGEVSADQIHECIQAWHADHAHVQLHVYLGLTWLEFRTWLKEDWLPQADEHAEERGDAIWVTGPSPDDESLLRVHPPMRCRPACPIHWPSDHPLADAPLHWDDAEGVLRRSCRHGLLHPDPDDQQVRLHPQLLEHDCDGCCTAAVIDGDYLEPDEPVSDLLRAFNTATERGITERPR